MCGRFALAAMPEEVQQALALADIEDFPPRYNIAPTQPILIVMAAPDDGEPGRNMPARRALLARWGLLPGWVKDEKAFPLLINARSETAADKPAFRAAMRHRRVLIPASGFYEWRRGEGKKAPAQPFWLRPRHGGVIAFGGVMESFCGADGAEIDTAAILTTAANDDLAAIHDRMPVVIEPDDFQRWLDCRTSEPRDVADLCRPMEPGFFEAIPVSTAVNSVANDNASLVEPADAIASKPADAGADPADKTDGQLTLF